MTIPHIDHWAEEELEEYCNKIQKAIYGAFEGNCRLTKTKLAKGVAGETPSWRYFVRGSLKHTGNEKEKGYSATGGLQESQKKRQKETQSGV